MRDGGMLWLFFSPSGRISRQVYWLSLGFLWVLMGILVDLWLRGLPGETAIDSVTLFDFLSANFINGLFVIVSQFCVLMLAMKRCQDCNVPGLWAFLVFLPFVNIAFVLGLGLVPGSAGGNRYGPVTNRPPNG